jgi:TrmH family RNA methyltransferase
MPRLLLKAPPLENLRVVLVGTRNPLNIGAAARALSNFGFSQLAVVRPYEPAFREAKSAVGGRSLLKRATQYASVAEAVADCRFIVGTASLGQRTPQQPFHDLKEGARLIRNRLASGPVALLFGSEKAGLSNEDLNHCHCLLTIPTSEANLSMNLGQAVAVCLYELIRPSATPRTLPKELPTARSGELERITKMLFDILARSGYVKPRTQVSAEAKVRRLVRRLQIDQEDARTLLGMFRQISWKMGTDEA